jgi:hypothetical protein
LEDVGDLYEGMDDIWPIIQARKISFLMKMNIELSLEKEILIIYKCKTYDFKIEGLFFYSSKRV